MPVVEVQIVSALNGGLLSAYLSYDNATNAITSLRYANTGPPVTLTGAAYDKAHGTQLYRGSVVVPTGSLSVPSTAIPGGPWKVIPISGKAEPDLPWTFSLAE